MRVRIKKTDQRENEEVVIRCVDITSEVRDIYTYVQSRGTEIAGMADGKLCSFSLRDVCYFEALDEKVFAYTTKEVYEVKMRLYEVEETYAVQHFTRCSKSIVLNLMQLEGISPTLNGRFLAHMKNGEKIMITRSYVPKLKAIITGKAAE